MRTKVTLVLLFLNVALFFFIFQFERRWRTEDAWKVTRTNVLGPEATDIRALEVTGGTHILTLKKVGDTWFVKSPLDWPANPNAVNRILTELQFLKHETSFSVADLAKSGQSLADYGLDQPRLTLTITSGDPSSPSLAGPATRVTRLRIGDLTKDGLLLYLLSPDGERIHVVSATLARSLGLTFDDLRADALFTIQVFEARSLSLQTAAPASLRIRLRRDGGRWSFETPIVARASKTATELAINGLNQLRVDSFVTANLPATRPMDKPSLRITLEGNNRRETVFPVKVTSKWVTARQVASSRSLGHGWTIMAAWTSSKTPRSSIRILPPPPSSAGVPMTRTVRPSSSTRGRSPSPAPTAVAAMTLCPQAWPTSGRASYSAQMAMTSGPVPASATNAVGRSAVPVVTAKPPVASASAANADERTSSKESSGCSWIA